MAAGVYLSDLVDAEQLSGYESYPGQDVSNDNYLCPGSLYQGEIIGGCRLNGTVTVGLQFNVVPAQQNDRRCPPPSKLMQS